MKRITLLCAAALALTFGTSPARADAICPKDSIQMIVPLAAGTGIDIATRTLAEKMSKILGQPIVVINLPGADGLIGAQFVNRASPDGCTLGSLTSGSLVVVTWKAKTRGEPLPYDPLRGFTPIGKTFEFAFVIGVNNKFPTPSVEGVVVYAKANPGMLKFAVSVPPHDLAMALFRRHYGIDIIPVPYRRGDVTAIPDLLSGVLNGCIMSVNAALPRIESGEYKPLAVFSKTRHLQLPDVRTFDELGIKETNVVVPVQGLFAPPGLPAEKVARLNAALNQALADEEVRKLLLRQGAKPDASSSEELSAGIEAQINAWGALLKDKIIELK